MKMQKLVNSNISKTAIYYELTRVFLSKLFNFILKLFRKNGAMVEVFYEQLNFEMLKESQAYGVEIC